MATGRARPRDGSLGTLHVSGVLAFLLGAAAWRKRVLLDQPLVFLQRWQADSPPPFFHLGPVIKREEVHLAGTLAIELRSIQLRLSVTYRDPIGKVCKLPTWRVTCCDGTLEVYEHRPLELAVMVCVLGQEPCIIHGACSVHASFGPAADLDQSFQVLGVLPVDDLGLLHDSRRFSSIRLGSHFPTTAKRLIGPDHRSQVCGERRALWPRALRVCAQANG